MPTRPLQRATKAVLKAPLRAWRDRAHALSCPDSDPTTTGKEST